MTIKLAWIRKSVVASSAIGRYTFQLFWSVFIKKDLREINIIV